MSFVTSADGGASSVDSRIPTNDSLLMSRLPPRPGKLKVAVAIDDDIVGKVRKQRTSCTRSRYDTSVVEALRSSCRQVDIVAAIEGSTRTLESLARIRPDVVVNLAFSATPMEASFAGSLELIGMPYTGSGPTGIVLSRDKLQSHQLLAQADVRVPRWVGLQPGVLVEVDLRPPLIVKPSSLAGSEGIYNDSVVRDASEVKRLALRIFRRFGVPVLCEEFIVGRDLRIGLIETPKQRFRISGISEWTFGAADPGWGYKTEAVRLNAAVRARHRITRGTAELSPPQLRRLSDTCNKACRALGIRGYAAVDLRLDRSGEPVVLEVNSNPGLRAGSSIWARPDFRRNLHDILRAAFREKM